MEEFLYAVLIILVALLIVFIVCLTNMPIDGGVEGTTSSIHLQPIPIVMPKGGTQVILLPR